MITGKELMEQIARLGIKDAEGAAMRYIAQRPRFVYCPAIKKGKYHA